MDQKKWETCVAFHGHSCGGLAIGYRAALYAASLLELSFSEDEQVVCISENDASGTLRMQRGQRKPVVSHDGKAGVFLL